MDAEEEEEEEQPSEQAAEDEASEGAEGEPPSGQPEESTPAADESEDQPRRKTFEGPNALQMLLRHTSAQVRRPHVRNSDVRNAHVSHPN